MVVHVPAGRRLLSISAACAVCLVAASALVMGVSGCGSDPEVGAGGGGVTPAPSYEPVPAPSQNPVPPGSGPREGGAPPPPPPPPPKDAAVDTAVPDTAPPPDAAVADTSPG